MKSRCYRRKHVRFCDYGGRGIIVCEEWKDDFCKFKEWALSNGYSDDLTIDRIDVDGNYCPENCRWIPIQEQAKNKRTSHYVNIDGNTMNITEAAKVYSVPRSTMRLRELNGKDLLTGEKAKGVNYG